jgi:hypothetical protein
MQDHNRLGPPVTNDGFLSAGQSQNTHISAATLSFPDKRCLAERAVVYVDCSLARSGYAGRRWYTQLNAEGEQRHRDFLSIEAARKAFGVEAIPYGLTLPSTVFTISGQPQLSAAAEVQQ